MTSEPPSNSAIDYQLTGERHVPVFHGFDMSLANVDHMVRYAFAAPFVTGKRVLDISCGTGYGAQFLALQGASEVVGVDVDRDAIEFASKFYSHPQVSFLQSDAHYVRQLEDASFDLIVSFETIEHLDRPRQFMTELRRLLKPDGQLFISCPNDYRVTPWISEYHLHRFRFTEFRDLFLSLFEEGVFLGQHLVVASCLVKPIAPDAKTSRYEAYRSGLPIDFFGKQYLEHLSAIDQADTYLAVFGVEEAQLQNQSSLSQNAFQMLMQILCHHEKAVSPVAALTAQLAQVQAELNQATQTAIAAQRHIEAMESSKFWKLRQAWMKLKRTLGLLE